MMFSGAETGWRHQLVAGLLGVAVLLTVMAEHIEHSGQQYVDAAAKPAGMNGNASLR